MTAAPIDLQMRLLAGLPDEAWAILRERSDDLPPGFKPLTVGDHRRLAELVGIRLGYFEERFGETVANEECTLMFLRVVLPALEKL